MQMNIESEHLNGLKVLVPEVFEDERGFFMEVYREDQFRELGIPDKFVQDNHSRSQKGVLRGLHFQYAPPMGKLAGLSMLRCGLRPITVRMIPAANESSQGSPVVRGMDWTFIRLTASTMRNVNPAGSLRC